MSEFVPRTQLEWDFLCWVREKEGYVPVDRIVSGQGIASWYFFLKERSTGTGGGPSGDSSQAAAVDADIAASDQPAGVIAAHGTPGQAGSVPLCCQAIDCFLDTLGAEAGNMAMRFLARGGVYIAGGGIAKKLLGRIKDGRVLKAYLERGPASDIVENCPLYVSDEDDMGLKGALLAAKMLVMRNPQ
jgi:glucokinase